MANNINTLNNQLFDQLKRLNTDINGDDLKAEIERAKAMSGIASEIFKGAKLQLDAADLIAKGKVYKEDLNMFDNKLIDK